MKTVQIDVTEADIASGIRGICRLCPIAHAMVRTLGDGEAVIGNTRWLWNGHRGDLPNSVTRFIERFDDFGAHFVKPFSFTVEIDS